MGVGDEHGRGQHDRATLDASTAVNRQRRVRQPNFWAMSFVTCVTQIAGIFAWQSLDGRIDGRLLFGPNRGDETVQLLSAIRARVSAVERIGIP